MVLAMTNFVKWPPNFEFPSYTPGEYTVGRTVLVLAWWRCDVECAMVDYEMNLALLRTKMNNRLALHANSTRGQRFVDSRREERACNSTYACGDGEMLVLTKNRTPPPPPLSLEPAQTLSKMGQKL